MNAKTETTFGKVNLLINFLKGIILVIFGIWLLKSPGENFSRLCIIFGILIILGGLFEIALAFDNRQKHKKWNWTITSGIVDVLIGAFLVANPTFILLIITVLVGIWIFIRGIILIRKALLLKNDNNPKYKYSLIIGIIFIVLALIFAIHPQVLGITIIFWTALAFISLGIFRLVLNFKALSV